MKYVLLLLPLLLVAACADEDVPFIPPISFAQQPPIALNVATVEVVDEYVPPKTLPNVEHAAPTPPYRAVREWAGQRLKAAGTTGYVRVGIRDASIVRKPLIGHYEYDGRLDVTLDADSGDGLHTATADITVSRQVTVDKDQDLAQQERTWDDLTRQMMADFDKGAQNALATNLGQFRMGNGASGGY